MFHAPYKFCVEQKPGNERMLYRLLGHSDCQFQAVHKYKILEVVKKEPFCHNQVISLKSLAAVF